MPTFITKDLIASLEADMRTFLKTAGSLKDLRPEKLNKQPGPGRWSAVQVLEHLNTYNHYYLPLMEQAISRAKANKATDNIFRSGWLGNYFVKTMYSDVVSKKQVSNKMKAAKQHLPASSPDADMVLAEFMTGAQQLIKLMQSAQQLDLAKIRIPISIAPLLRISLGDTFRFMVAHQARHFLQIANALNDV